MMNKKLLDRLLKIRNITVLSEGSELKYRLVSFTDTMMSKDSIPGTPFRAFESVPQGRVSKRRQNDTMSFDPYVDTLFDYPLIVNAALGGNYDALEDLNWHLTIQLPYCGMDCWHCYNDKGVCTAGLGGVPEIRGSLGLWTTKEILEAFARCRRQGRTVGRIYNVLRVSGGEPFLAIELLAELLKLIHANSQKVHSKQNPDYPLAVWTETNLITWAELKNGRSVVKKSCEQPKRPDLDIRSLLTTHASRLIIHPCFHGLTDENLQQCTGNKDLALKDLHNGFRNIHEFFAGDHGNGATASPNLYPTFIAEACDPSGVKPLFDFLHDIHPSYPLKVAVISVDDYGPLEQRMADRKKQKRPFFCYPRYASLRRWNDMIKSKYGIAYGQIPRPMADTIAGLDVSYAPRSVNPDYKPILILLKSVYRDEYRQELLTVLAAPPGTRFSTAYDTKHIDPSTRVCLKAGRLGFGTKPLTVLIVYSNPDSSTDQGRYLPLRWGTLKEVHVTEHLVHFEIQLDETVSVWSSGKSGNGILLEDFSCNMREYFGNRVLLERPTIRWILLGEQNYLFEREASPPLTIEKTWDNLLSSMQSLGFSKLAERSIFLQVLEVSKSDAQESDVSLEEANADRILDEGNKMEFIVRYYIPKFDHYSNKPELNDSRSLSITSTDKALSIEGYECRPLSKYGEIHFSVVCGELSHSRKATIIMKSKDRSPYCPRVEVPFHLKKAYASGG